MRGGALLTGNLEQREAYWKGSEYLGSGPRSAVGWDPEQVNFSF